jgi:hypothetical protein
VSRQTGLEKVMWMREECPSLFMSGESDSADSAREEQGD